MRKFPIVAASFLFPATAFAHSGAPGHDLAYGFAHPLGGLDHVLAMVAVGILAALIGRRAIWALPLSFVAMMVAGFGLGMMHLNLPLAELGIAVSVIAIGGAIAWAGALSLPAAMALVGVFSVFHGYAHGIEAPADLSVLPFVAGFVTATALLHALGVVSALAAVRLSTRLGRSFVRAGGGLVALGGVGILLGWF